MPLEFINPNWHVIAIHAPLGLLTVGVLIELFSFLWRQSSARVAARWMILIGTLALLPVGTLGLYAFRDVVTAGASKEQDTWKQVVEASPWIQAQWDFIKWHIVFTAIATGLLLIGTLLWMGASDDGRRKLHWPVMVLLLAGVGLAGAGAWNAGEAIYRHGTAVERVAAVPQTGPATDTAPTVQLTKPTSKVSAVQYYVSPTQLHVLLAGLTLALVFGALGVSLRRWALQGKAPSAWQATPPPNWQEPVIVRPPGGPPGTMESSVVPPAQSTPLRSARFWLLAFLAAAATTVVGMWIADDWRLEEGLMEPLRDTESRQLYQRVFAHVLCGLGIVALPLLVALIARIARRAKFITLCLVLLLVLTAAAQVWLGILLLFDSSYGPVTSFNS